MSLSEEEINFLKGYTLEELDDYLREYPQRIDNVEEFKKTYYYSYRINRWKRRSNEL
jgi:hypothetical protein